MQGKSKLYKQLFVIFKWRQQSGGMQTSRWRAVGGSEGTQEAPGFRPGSHFSSTNIDLIPIPKKLKAFLQSAWGVRLGSRAKWGRRVEDAHLTVATAADHKQQRHKKMASGFGTLFSPFLFAVNRRSPPTESREFSAFS